MAHSFNKLLISSFRHILCFTALTCHLCILKLVLNLKYLNYYKPKIFYFQLFCFVKVHERADIHILRHDDLTNNAKVTLQDRFHPGRVVRAAAFSRQITAIDQLIAQHGHQLSTVSGVRSHCLERPGSH